MSYRQFPHHKSGCASHLLGCGRGGAAAVIEPVGSVEPFTRGGRGRLPDRPVIETHAHADQRSSARELAQATGADVSLWRRMPARVSFKPLDEEEVLDLGRVHPRVLYTPGHTPGSVSLVGEDRARVSELCFVLTGDTLMVGDLARPDLILDEGTSVLDQVRALHASPLEKILPLGDVLEIHSGPFGSSPCGGQHMSR